MVGGVVYLCSMVCRIVLYFIFDVIFGSLICSFYNYVILMSFFFFSWKWVFWMWFFELNEVMYWMDDVIVFE